MTVAERTPPIAHSCRAMMRPKSRRPWTRRQGPWAITVLALAVSCTGLASGKETSQPFDVVPSGAYSEPAFQNAPAPQYSAYTIRYRNPTGGPGGEGKVRVVSHDGTLLTLEQRSDNDLCHRRYLLDGLLQVGLHCRIGQRHADHFVTAIQAVEGRLFPLAIGNRLTFTTVETCTNCPRTTHVKRSLTVVGEGEAAPLDAKTGQMIYRAINGIGRGGDAILGVKGPVYLIEHRKIEVETNRKETTYAYFSPQRGLIVRNETPAVTDWVVSITGDLANVATIPTTTLFTTPHIVQVVEAQVGETSAFVQTRTGAAENLRAEIDAYKAEMQNQGYLVYVDDPSVVEVAVTDGWQIDYMLPVTRGGGTQNDFVLQFLAWAGPNLAQNLLSGLGKTTAAAGVSGSVAALRIGWSLSQGQRPDLSAVASAGLAAATLSGSALVGSSALAVGSPIIATYGLYEILKKRSQLMRYSGNLDGEFVMHLVRTDPNAPSPKLIVSLYPKWERFDRPDLGLTDTQSVTGKPPHKAAAQTPRPPSPFEEALSKLQGNGPAVELPPQEQEPKGPVLHRTAEGPVPKAAPPELDTAGNIMKLPDPSEADVVGRMYVIDLGDPTGAKRGAPN